jgi:hypothetical protein
MMYDYVMCYIYIYVYVCVCLIDIWNLELIWIQIEMNVVDAYYFFKGKH